MENKDSLLEVLRTLFRWKKQLLFVLLASALLTLIVTLLLPVYYKASTTFLAASPDQAKPDLLYKRGQQSDANYYGNDSDIDRLLTIAESRDLLQFLIDSFQLYQHYRIDSIRPKARHIIQEKLLKRYTIKKTKRDALELSIEDRQPQRAAHMANAARDKIDEIARGLIKDAQRQTIRAYEFNLANKQSQLKLIGDTLAVLRQRYGIFNPDAQTEALTDQYARAEARLARNSARLNTLRNTSNVPRDTLSFLMAEVSGLEQEVNLLREKMDRLNKGLALVSTASKQYLEANQSLGEDLERFKILTAAQESFIPAIILVEKATPPIVKSRPKRAIIIAATLLVVVIFTIVGILLLENYREVNWREIVYGR
jgi:tyrosine-protein kinase Etk/Wzc